MKNIYLLVFFFLCAGVLIFSSCALEKEASIPTGITNQVDPVFATAEVTPDTNDNFQVKARLSKLGNLNIHKHGWVWSETPGPTLQNAKLESGALTIDSFSMIVTGLDKGKPYHLRPYVITGADTLYGPEQCSFLGVNFAINTDQEIFQGADVQFTNTSAGSNTYSWNFGDGASSMETSPKHTFNTLGDITVPVTVTVQLTAKSSGCTVTKGIVLKVIPDPFQNYWAALPGGTFMMGCTSEQEPDCIPGEYPVSQVTLSPFFMGKTEVTQGQWLAITGKNPSYNDLCGLDCPVEVVSWDRIVEEFIPVLNRKTGRINRLPTEAEWEYAARSNSTTKYSGSDDLDSVAWYHDNSDLMTHPVAQKKPNGFGLYDMSGNVLEWCSDWYGAYLSINQTNPTGPATGDMRVIRCGSWGHAPQYCRTAHRYSNKPSYRAGDVGFRLARSF